MVTKLQDIKIEDRFSAEEMVHTMELEQEAKKSDVMLHCEKKSEEKGRVVEDKIDAFEITKLLLKEI